MACCWKRFKARLVYTWVCVIDEAMSASWFSSSIRLFRIELLYGLINWLYDTLEDYSLLAV